MLERLISNNPLKLWLRDLRIFYYRSTITEDFQDRLEVPRIVFYGLLWGLLNPVIIGYLFIWIPCNLFMSTDVGLKLFQMPVDVIETRYGWDYMHFDKGLILYFICSIISILILGIQSGPFEQIDCDWVEFIFLEEKIMGVATLIGPICYLPIIFMIYKAINQSMIEWNPEYSLEFHGMYLIIITLAIVPFWVVGIHFWMFLRIITNDYYD